MNSPLKKVRYRYLQALPSQNGDECITLVELGVLDAQGKPIGHKGWKVRYVDSEGKFAEGDQAELPLMVVRTHSGTRCGAHHIQSTRMIKQYSFGELVFQAISLLAHSPKNGSGKRESGGGTLWRSIG